MKIQFIKSFTYKRKMFVAGVQLNVISVIMTQILVTALQ